VQYKSQASALFQDLFSSMRLAVISRLFTYQPRQTPERAFGLRSGDGHDTEPAMPIEEAEAALSPTALADGMENPQTETDTTEAAPAQPDPEDSPPGKKPRKKLSRSQKRRRRRKEQV
jgi:preprotein translocase subunit SecA